MGYRRVVIKLSGAALSGPEPVGLDAAALEHVASEVLAVAEHGVQVAIVVGGGNFFRGRPAEHWGIERAEADNVGILGTVMNGLMLRGVLKARTDREVRVMTAMPIPAVAEPFIRLRARAHLDRGSLLVLAGGLRPALRDHGLPGGPARAGARGRRAAGGQARRRRDLSVA